MWTRPHLVYDRKIMWNKPTPHAQHLNRLYPMKVSPTCDISLAISCRSCVQCQARGKSTRNISHHPLLDGTPCDRHGNDLPPNSPPPPPDKRAETDFTPFKHGAEFKFAEFLYSKAQMSGGKLDELMQLLAALYPNDGPPFADVNDLYGTIDSISEGDIPWQNFAVTYNGEVSANAAPWKTAQYEVWFRDPLLVMEGQIGNPDFVNDIDYAPKRVVDEQGKRQYSDLMSGNWAWQQAVRRDCSFVGRKLMHYHCRIR
jgi:hypothetical protein